MPGPKISATEFEVMKIAWGKAPVSAQEISAALEGDFKWSRQTVKTLLGRLVKKGALTFVKEGKTYYYSPLTSREECVAAESNSFLNRFFGGALDAMVMHFARGKNLSEKELKELSRILNKIE